MSQLASRFGRNAIVTHSNTPISEDRLRRLAPSVFAETAHESRSHRYSYIPTFDVLRGLMSHGFQPYFAMQARTRVEGKENYTKHMIKLRHPDHMVKPGHATVGDTVNEVVLLNSHDGTSAYEMSAGVFRFVCSNGMLVPHATVATIKVKHSGKVIDEVATGAFQVMESFEAIDAAKDGMQAAQLSDGEQRAFATAALALRYPEQENGPPITAEQALTVRRWDDRGGSVWNTFQRLQENLVQGGLLTTQRERHARTRPVNGIDGNVALNRGLWVLAEEMRKLRAAS